MPTIESHCISDAWRRAVSACLGATKHEIYGLSVEIRTAGSLDDLSFRASLNRLLAANNRGSVETVARTIFPIGLWNPRAKRSQLYERYLSHSGGLRLRH
jgi:hypothetical protein